MCVCDCWHVQAEGGQIRCFVSSLQMQMCVLAGWGVRLYGSVFLAEVVKRRKWRMGRWEQNVLWSGKRRREGPCGGLSPTAHVTNTQHLSPSDT